MSGKWLVRRRSRQGQHGKEPVSYTHLLKDKEDIEIVSIREDDGYSGATFDRPAFKLMMQDVKE